jgi:hypothetical protein
MSADGVSFSIAGLADRAIEALAQVDSVSLRDVLKDCAQAEVPASAEEFSKALTMQAAFEQVLHQTERTLQVLSRKEDKFHYGRNQGRNS